MCTVVDRNRIRQYPAFVNCTTIDWFAEWPYEALIEVAERYLSDMKLDDEEEVRVNICSTYIISLSGISLASSYFIYVIFLIIAQTLY